MIDKKELETFTKVFRELFFKEDITQVHLSELTNISRHKINHWLRGNTYPNGADFRKIGEHYGYTFDEFWKLTHPDERW